MKTVLFLFTALLSLGLSAQQLEREVMASGSSTYSDNEINVTSTIGQPVVGSVFGGNNALTQGFQQPAEEELSTGTFRLFDDYSAEVFPNPATDQVYFRYSLPGYDHLQLSISDLLGNTLIEGVQVMGDQDNRISLSQLTSGCYLLVLRTEDRQIASTHPIIIQQ